MFIIIQQPFIDFRTLKDSKDDKYFFPHAWMKKPFYIRYFGRKKDRENAEGMPLPEQTFFMSRKVFTSLHHERINASIVFTRLFTDDFFFHFDIGIRIKDTDTIDDPLQILHDLFDNGKLRAKYPKGKELPFSLSEWQQHLENLYAYATTHIIDKKYSNDSINKSDIYFGAPIVLCQSSFDENNPVILKSAHTLQNGVRLYKRTLKTAKCSADVWIMQKDNENESKADQLRNLRVCLLKLHNYREGLIGFFKYIKTCPLESLKLDELNKEFAYLLKLLKRPTWHGVDGKRIMDYAVEEEVNNYYETWDKLISNVEESFNEIKLMQKERIKVPESSTTIIIGGNNEGPINVGGTQTVTYNPIPSNSPQDFEKLCKDFFAEFNTRINEIVDAEVKEVLEKRKQELEDGLKSNKKVLLASAWGAVKAVLGPAVIHADKLTVLVALGETLFKMVHK